MITYVIGFIGSARMNAAVKLAALMGEDTAVYDLDAKIEESDGRTIKELVMTMGEHEYRNKENALLKEILGEVGTGRAIVVCGDGIVLDDDNAEILKAGQICFVNDPLLSMWERARNEEKSHHAFLYDEDEEKSFASFQKLYDLRLPLYEEVVKAAKENVDRGEGRQVLKGKIL